MTDTKSDKSSPQLVPWSARVRHSYLRLAERFAAGADENPALEGIRLEPHSRGGVVVIGANRHGMGLFYGRKPRAVRPPPMWP